MVNDRHLDPEPYVFTTPEAAIGFARSEAERIAARHGNEGYCVVQEEPVDGWLYHATFCVEGEHNRQASGRPVADNVWVIEKRIDQPDNQEAPDG